LDAARNIILAHRDPETPVGIVTGAMRQNQEVRIVPLQALGEAPVGMQTTLFVGSRSSSRYLDFMFTPRGYSGKYEIR
jgi:precorrin-3B C17-methyltransferase